jgi:hypothetical protein
MRFGISLLALGGIIRRNFRVDMGGLLTLGRNFDINIGRSARKACSSSPK